MGLLAFLNTCLSLLLFYSSVVDVLQAHSMSSFIRIKFYLYYKYLIIRIIDVVNTVFLIIGLFFFFSLLYFSTISYFEREILATKRSLILAILLLIPFLLFASIDFPFKLEIQTSILIILTVLLIFLFIPVNMTKHLPSIPADTKIDERDIMFSRSELEPETDRFIDYYSKNVQNKLLDDNFRKFPGLLNSESLMYDELMAKSADASFATIEALHTLIENDPSHTPKNIHPPKLTKYVKNWCKKLGAVDTGITELKEHHLYSYAGRKHNYGDKIINDHTNAISFTVEMDYDMVKGGPAFPIVMESAQEYLNAGQIAIQLAIFLRSLGYSARAHIDGNYQVICPLVARDAGLGEIGRMGLLMTPKLGPRVRIGVVTTDAPLHNDSSTNDYSILDFCSKCKKCAICCPSSAIQEEDRKMINGALRWQINSEACYTYWCKVGSDCGRCVAVCPYSHPNNFPHNFVRWGISNSSIFRTLALMLDDFFYGKKPQASRIPTWLNE